MLLELRQYSIFACTTEPGSVVHKAKGETATKHGYAS